MRARPSVLIALSVLGFAGVGQAGDDPKPVADEAKVAAAAAPPAAPTKDAPSSPAAPAPANGDKQVAGMSILGDDEAPKALVLVPWKSADLGRGVAVAEGLDAGRDPVDRKSFARSVDYYEVRAGHDH